MWSLPRTFNIGVACSDARDARAVAVVEAKLDGSVRSFTFGDLAALSDRLANAFRGLGVARGDRVAIVLPQRIEAVVSHLALYKLGAVAVPMSVLLGPDGLQERLGDSEARLAVTDSARVDAVAEAASACDTAVVVVDGEPARPHRGFWNLVEQASPRLVPAVTRADDPALLLYTSGTTGAPKGALHAHRTLLGHLPGVELSHDGFPQPGDRFWTAADWAWIAGLLDVLLPSLLHGRPVVGAAREGRFDPEWAARVIVDHGVRNVFLQPTALRMMREAGVRIEPGTLRTLASGGEMLGTELLAWAGDALGVGVNEIYGQTEANYVVGNSASWPVKPGSMGRAYPGHEVAVLRADAAQADVGELGELAVRLPDPVALLGYWRNEEATCAKVSGEWLRTGDLAKVDVDGYLWFHTRADDVIISAGYRIGPEEIEQCLLRHPAVALAAVIGIPDELRGQAVKAFIRLAHGVERSASLEVELRELVRRRLGAYEYPREIEFVDELPLTVTGKVRRGELRPPEVPAASRKRAGAAAVDARGESW